MRSVRDPCSLYTAQRARLQKTSSYSATAKWKTANNRLRIGPDARGFTETGGGGEARKTFQGVLVGIFGNDFFAARESEFPAADPDGLFRLADEVHLDAALALVVNALVAPKRKIEVRAELTIGPSEQVEIELSRDAGASL